MSEFEMDDITPPRVWAKLLHLPFSAHNSFPSSPPLFFFSFPVFSLISMDACLAGEEEHSSLDTSLPPTSTTTTTAAATSPPFALKHSTVGNPADIAAIVLAADDPNAQSTLAFTQDMALNLPSSLVRPSSKSKRSPRPSTASLAEDRLQNLPEVRLLPLISVLSLCLAPRF